MQCPCPSFSLSGAAICASIKSRYYHLIGDPNFAGAWIKLWNNFDRLDMPTVASPSLRPTFVKVFAEVATHDVLLCWKHRLNDSYDVTQLCDLVIGGLQPGAEDIFVAAAGGNRAYLPRPP